MPWAPSPYPKNSVDGASAVSQGRAGQSDITREAKDRHNSQKMRLMKA